MKLKNQLAPLTVWDDRLAFDFALSLEGSGESIQAIQTRSELTDEELRGVGADPIFQKRVAAYREDIASKGLTFRLKAKAQAEMLLDTSWDIIHSNEVPAAVKADLIKSTVKWGGLEAPTANNEGGSGGVSITINMGAAQPQVIQAKVIDV